jgi:hypothetical protein
VSELFRECLRQAFQPRAHVLDQLVIASQRSLQFGELLALREQPLGQRLLRRQHPLAQALGEGILANGSGFLETARRVQVELRPGALQVLGIDHAIEGRQFAFPDPLLQAHARNAKEMRRAGKGQPLGHPANIAKATVGRFQYFYVPLDPAGTAWPTAPAGISVTDGAAAATGWRPMPRSAKTSISWVSRAPGEEAYTWRRSMASSCSN